MNFVIKDEFENFDIDDFRKLHIYSCDTIWLQDKDLCRFAVRALGLEV